MNLKCLIADDEPLAHHLLEHYMGQLKMLTLAGNAYNAFEVLDFLSNHPIDILFLDISMPDLSGIDLLKTLSHPPIVILTTAHSEHSLEAYELGVMDYLLKPIKFERFLKAVNRVIDYKKMALAAANSGKEADQATEQPVSDFFFVKDGSTSHKVKFEDILYAQAYGNFVKIVTTQHTITASTPLKSLEAELPAHTFMRVHKSYLINYQKIDKVEGHFVFINQMPVPIGALYKLGLDKKTGR